MIKPKKTKPIHREHRIVWPNRVISIKQMYTGYKGNTSVNKSMSSVNTRTLGGESQLEGLQREVDNYTRKL